LSCKQCVPAGRAGHGQRWTASTIAQLARSLWAAPSAAALPEKHGYLGYPALKRSGTLDIWPKVSAIFHTTHSYTLCLHRRSLRRAQATKPLVARQESSCLLDPATPDPHLESELCQVLQYSNGAHSHAGVVQPPSWKCSTHAAWVHVFTPSDGATRGAPPPSTSARLGASLPCRARLAVVGALQLHDALPVHTCICPAAPRSPAEHST
jgi:hypothetical protein